MTTAINYQRYDAHTKQRDFHRALQTHDVALFNGGRGSGKTTAGAIQAILEAAQHQQGSRGIIVAPTYPMLRDATLPELMRWLPRHWIERKREHPQIDIYLKNGSEIAFRSADNPDSLRGPNRAWGWFDEPRNIKTREAFDIVYAQLRPTRKFWLTTTPAGIYHWLYELFVDDPIPNSAVINVRTIENPYLPAEYERGLRAQYTGTFAAQELDAAWVSFEGLIYDTFSLENNVSEDAEYDPALPVWWGVDDGYALGSGPGSAGYHPRAIVLAQQTPTGGVNVFAEYYEALRLPEQSIDEVLSWPYEAPQLALVDSSAAELRQRMVTRNIFNGGATHRVSEGVKVVRRFVQDGNGQSLLRIHPRCTNLIREMQTYRYDDRSRVANAGEPKPLKIDDHAVDALRYLLWQFR